MDGGEHAGGVVGDDRAPVVVGGQGEPAEFVEGLDVGSCDVDGTVERAACGDVGDDAGDIRGGDRLDWCAWQADGVAVGGHGQGRVHELHELGGADDGIGDRPGLEDVS